MANSLGNGVFASARSKIKWADKHIQEFQRTMVDFLRSGAYAATVQDDPETQGRIFQIVRRHAVPNSFPFLLGDAIHNLRSALDHVAYEIVERSGCTPSEGLVFPIKDTREEVINAIKSEIQIAGGTDLVSLIVDRIQPHRGGRGDGHALWVLHRLDCIDKHRELLPAVDEIGFDHIVAVDQEGTTYTGMRLVSVGGGKLEWAWPGSLEGKKLRATNDGKLTFAIRLKEVDIVKGQTAQTLLPILRLAVVRTVDEIAAAYSSTTRT